VVTRRPEQSEWLCTRLRELGATVVELPLIAVVPPADTAPLDGALRAVGRYDWVIFTSANGVRAVAERARDLGLTPAAWRHQKVASIGPSTTAALREAFAGVEVAVEPATHDAQSVLGELAAHARGSRFLLPTSDRARDALAEGLRAEGAQVDVVVAYRTVAPEGLRDRVFEALRDGADAVTFASPSAVENLMAAAGALVPRVKAAVIGPVTEEACRRAGIEIVAVATPSTAEGLAASLERLFSC
jgi:uroporphyrinogen III methyltransferase/synthase